MVRGGVGRHRPLFSYRNPRDLSGGRSAYVYRREAGAATGFDGVGGRKFPTLYMTEKIKDKAGLVFFNCPHFKHLRESEDVFGSSGGGGGRGLGSDEMADLQKNGRLRLKTLNKKAEECDKDEKKLKQKRKGKKDPSVRSIKDHLRKIIKYHEKQVADMIPSIYPMLGPANSDSDNEEERKGTRDEKREHTKRELKTYNVN